MHRLSWLLVTLPVATIGCGSSTTPTDSGNAVDAFRPPDAADPVDAGPPRCTRAADCTDPARPVCDAASGECVVCTALDRGACTVGQYCDAGACAAGCETDEDCVAVGGAGMRCRASDHACVGCVSDDQCALGTLCEAATSTCIAGCTATHGCAGATEECCGSACVDVETSVAHCGACDAACTVASGTGACVAGMCEVASCTLGSGDCNGDPTDGCETDTTASAEHCGACGATCDGTCGSGACTLFTDCAALHAARPALPSGEYDVDPDGSGPGGPVTVYCDMTADGGGWTLVARILRTSGAHYDTGAVGSLTSPTQSTTAKLSDDEINRIRGNLATSVVRLDCGASVTYFQEDRAFSATSASGALMRCSSSPSGPWETATAYGSHHGLNTYLAPSCPYVIYSYQYSAWVNGCFYRDPALGDGPWDGAMWVRPGTCASDSDCALGTVCDGATSRCVPS